jgi:hypothetical protein
MRALLGMLTMLTMLFLLPALLAGEYHNGYAHDGYTYGNGYWYRQGYAYTRQKVYYPISYAYNACGYLVQQPSTYYYSYTQVDNAPPYVPSVPAYNPDWKTQLLELARQRDAFEGALRKSDLDQRSYLEAIKALGLSGNFYWPNYGGYGASYGYMGHNYYNHGYGYNYGYVPPVVQGNTTYGYSVNTVKELYGSTDLNALYQQSARLTQGAQTLANQANSDFAGLVGQAGTNAGRVAEILARAQAARTALEATQLPPGSKTTITESGSITAPGAPVAPMPVPGPKTSVMPQGPMPKADDIGDQARSDALFLKTIAMPRCGACHSGKVTKGDLDITLYPSFDLERKKRVWVRLMTDNRDKLMPRNPDGGPGTPLSAQELQEFLSH